MIRDQELMFTGVGTSGYAPTTATENVAPLTIDTSPLGVPTGSGGAATTGYNAGSAANAGRDLGLGGEMWWYVLVTVLVAQSANDANFELVTNSTATISSVTVLLKSTAYAAATLVAGFRFATQLPALLTYKQYIGMAVNINSTAWTAGTVESGLVTNLQASDLYDSGFLVA